jgi:hypothetical protein
MVLLFKESGRSARIESRFFDRIIRIELTTEKLSFSTTLLTIKCKELMAIPLEEIQSVTRVKERGVDSFEVNTDARRKQCWFETVDAGQWESAFATAGVLVEQAPDKEEQRVATDA